MHIYCILFKVLKKAVYNSMNGTLQRRYTMQRLHLFPGPKVPSKLLKNVSNQIQQLTPTPKRLDHYTNEEVQEFPKIIDLPTDYIMK